MVRARSWMWLLCLAICLTVLTSDPVSVRADNPAISSFLEAGEFGPAIAAANALPAADRNAALARIAARQALSDARSGSLSTLGGIDNQQVRSETAQWLRKQPRVSARGGGVVADFDTLIELVTSTISPDSWLDNGGKGTISGFPTGVLVSPAGLMKRLTPVATPALDQLRQTARDRSSNRDHRATSSLRKVSLTRLEQAAQARYAAGQELTDDMRQLAGLTRIRYVFVYPDTQEIILAGPASDWKTDDEGRVVSTSSGEPVLHLDDFLETLRNAHESGEFGCAITPRRENLERTQQYLATTGKKALTPGKAAREEWVNGLRESLGLQDITIHGVDPRSRVARVIVEADHHMKLVGMGLEKGAAGVTGYLDSIRLAPGEAPPTMGVLRWWFTLGDGAIRASSAGDCYELTGNSVKVLSENEHLTARGERIHTGKSDELNQQFAESFTRNFAALAAEHAVYAELRNVFDFAVVAAVLRSREGMARTGWQALHFRSPEACPIATGEVPRQVMSVANYRLINGRTLVAGASGGVTVNAREKLSSSRVKTDNYGDLVAEQHSAKPAADVRHWWWD